MRMQAIDGDALIAAEKRARGNRVTAGRDYWRRAGWVKGAARWYEPQTTDEAAMLEVCGVYHWERNPYGVYRDHILPRPAGFGYKVFPQLLRHPANCRYIQKDPDEAHPTDKGVIGDVESLCRRIEL